MIAVVGEVPVQLTVVVVVAIVFVVIVAADEAQVASLVGKVVLPVIGGALVGQGEHRLIVLILLLLLQFDHCFVAHSTTFEVLHLLEMAG